MYGNDSAGFAFKNVILKIILIVVIVLLVVAFFPTKSYVSNLIDEKLGTSSNTVFNDNLQTLKEAALSYYNGERLPEEEEEMTLEEMIDNELILSLTDSEGKSCDVENSYVKVTAQDSDYKLYVNLACGDEEEHIISYFGSYDYCTSEVCEKKN